MSTYLVVLNEPDDAAWKRLAEKWPDRHYILNERVAAVAPEGISITEEVTEAIGMNETGKVVGIVAEIQHEALNGWNRRGLRNTGRPRTISPR